MKEQLINLGNDASKFLIDVVIALIILLIGFRIIAWLEKYLKREHKFSKLDKSVKGFIISFVIIALKVLLIVLVLPIVGVSTASLITIVGSCAVAVGLALQGGLSNIAGGLMLLIFKPFKVGDYINVNGFEGNVKSITMFYTTIRTLDNKEIQLPNGNLSNSNIINFSANDKRRVDLELSVSYDSDIDKVKKIVTNIVNKKEDILIDEGVTIRLLKHDASALVFVLRVWTKKENYWNIYFDLMEEIKNAFDKNNISIPYPQMDVHLKK